MHFGEEGKKREQGRWEVETEAESIQGCMGVQTEEVTAALREELRAVVASQEEGSGAQRDLMDSANQIRRLERDLELTQREAEVWGGWEGRSGKEEED